MSEEIILKRDILSNRAILGRLYYQGKEICKTLENPWLNNVPEVSCIPEGVYKVEPYSSKKYGDVWQVLDVPKRSYILFHVGNLEANTKGCILVGEAYGFIYEQLAVTNSRKTVDKLRGILPKEFSLTVCGGYE